MPQPVLPGGPALPGGPPDQEAWPGAGPQASVPAFGAAPPGVGPFDQGAARYGHGASPPPSRTSASRPTLERVTVAGAGPMWRALVIGGCALAGALLSRLLVDWDDGRWWMLTAGLEIVALVCGVIAVAFGVSALGDLVRERSVVKGTAAVGIGLPLACALVIGAGVAGVRDWETLDYPDAWDRLHLGQPEDKPSDLEKSLDDIDGGHARNEQDLRRAAKVGACYKGTPSQPGQLTDCEALHRMEVVGRVSLSAAPSPFPGEDALESIAEAKCLDVIRQIYGTDDIRGDLQVIVPDEASWAKRDFAGVCLARTRLSERGPAG